MRNPTERFTSRVENYVKYRPSYPEAILDLLRSECGLSPNSTVADIGSGTGISTSLLLRSGATVYAVEPNEAMRSAAEAQLHEKPNFHSVAASAEATTLPSDSVDLIVAGQAFHWFDPVSAEKEFRRILKPTGWVALMWNDRITGSTEFLIGYERFLREYMADYLKVNHKELDVNDFPGFFSNEVRVARFPNGQSFDYEGLLGRVLSSSYAPEPGNPMYEPMEAALRELYDRTSVNGKVDFLYETQVYYAQFG